MSKNKDIFFRIGLHFARRYPLQHLIGKTRQRLIVPIYHLVSDDPPPHISYLYNVKRTHEFEDDLDTFLTHYQPVPIEDLIEMIMEGRPIEKNIFALTFDDGLREFKEVVAPILIRKGIPATCFLNSDFVDNKAMFFRYKASLLIDHLKKEKLEKATVVQAWIRANGFSENTSISDILLSVPYERKSLLNQLGTTVRLQFDDYLKEKQPYLNSDEIRELQKQGFTFGAHSCDHPPYNQISFEEQKQQTAKSLYLLNDRFQLKQQLFAFPFTDDGVSADFFHWLYDREQKLVDLTFGTAGMKKDLYPKHIQRIPFELYDLSAEDVLRLEYLYFRIKGLLGRNRIKRL